MLSENKLLTVRSAFGRLGFLPIAILNDPLKAVKMAEVLVRNAVDLIEITLRTDRSLQCISEIKKQFPEMLVGCGSVLSRDGLDRAIEAGAQFAVAPIVNPALVEYARSRDMLFIPGTATPTELALAMDYGCSIVKVFPVEPLGGVEYLKAICAPFALADFQLLPTGGISEKNIAPYLALDRVLCCGASSVVDRTLIEREAFDELDARIKRLKDVISGNPTA